jgi:hypothetical protein
MNPGRAHEDKKRYNKDEWEEEVRPHKDDDGSK